MEFIFGLVVGVVTTILAFLAYRRQGKELQVGEDANVIAREQRDISKAAAESDLQQKLEAKRARLEVAGFAVQHSGPEVTAKPRVVNRADADATNVRMEVFRNGDLYQPGEAAGRISKSQRDGVQNSFPVQTAPFRSAIPDDEYRLVFTYSDEELDAKQFEICYSFTGQGNADRIGELRATLIDCPSRTE